MDPADLRLIVLAAGSSRRMGWNKLAAPLAGIPLAQRVADNLAGLTPLFVAAPEAAAVLAGRAGVVVLPTEPTESPGATLRLADAAIAGGPGLAVVLCDLPFLDASRVRAFIARVPPDADIAFPLVDGTPGHPVVWSARARQRLGHLPPGVSPATLRDDPELNVVALEETDDAYVADVDTPGEWAAAERRLSGDRP
jgi:molybdenum cofactor cytidylyltransferase/nicotine blue oxidoreductase